MAEEVPSSEEAKDRDRRASEAARWKTEIALYEREAEKFEQRAKKITRRYLDERPGRGDEKKSKMNVLWSNVQILLPALFAKNPVVNVDRRYHDDDDIGRFASEAIEHCSSFFVNGKFFETVRAAVLDRLLCGRGTVWIRYRPEFRPSEDGLSDELSSEEVVCDYVHWKDFGHSHARIWSEVTAVWRRVFMSQEDLKARFPAIAEQIPLDHAPEKMNDEKIPTEIKKATIYEIWDKTKKRVVWLHKDCPELLDESEDLLKLRDFFPMPKPMFSTLANESLFPVADYVEYQDQAEELDELTARIRLLTKAMKVAGVYAGDAPSIQRLLSEGLENIVIPVDNWAIFAEKGGLKGLIDYLPLKDIAAALVSLYEAREHTKRALYEISGISDILRGMGDAGETATGVRTKGQFATLRLGAMQQSVQRFNRDLIYIISEVIAGQFSPETIKKISGIKLLTAQEKQFAQFQMRQQAMMAQQAGQPPPPVPEKMQELLENPSWEDVFSLLKNSALRDFRIDIETDSTIRMDQESERQDRAMMLAAAGGFIQQAATITNPALQPLLMDMLMFGLRGFHVSRDIEGSFKRAQSKIIDEAENPQPKPDPESAKAQMTLMLEKMKMQAAQQNDAANVALEQEKMKRNVLSEQARMQADQQIEAAKMAHERDVAQKRLDHDNLKLSLSHALELKKIESSEKMAAADRDLAPNADGLTKLDLIQHGIAQSSQGIGQSLQQQQAVMEQQMQVLLNLAKGQSDTLAGIKEMIAVGRADKEVIRDAAGRVAGTRIVERKKK